MKKTAIIILMAFAAVCAKAQTAYDALLFSENNHEGTARTMAMGNAFTALGADLGSVSINPAGSAVAGYSQFTFTPALTISTSSTTGVSPYSDGSLPYFQDNVRSSITRLAMPNFGITLNYDTNRKSGVKNITFGFVVNKVAGWDEDVFACGTNSSTSFMGAMAYEATANGYLGSELGATNAYDIMPWKYAAGYQSGMISTFGGYDDQFAGASEVIFDNGEVALGGPLEQSYSRRTEGGKCEYLFNLGANISDFLYIGANLGINSISYSYDEHFKEVAIDPSDFAIGMANGDRMYWNDMYYKYSYAANGTGYFGKFGFILAPGNGFRFGAAIQTPAVNHIREEWAISAEATFSNSSYNGYSDSPIGVGSYTVISPYRANVGAAYTLGNFGLFSLDYELCDYGQMKYKSYDADRDYFEKINNDIRERFGISHIVRAGLEVKPASCIAVRAGYGMSTSSELYDSWGDKIPVSLTQNVSFGLGYSSPKSFFADMAIRKTFMPKEYYMPYSDYMFDEEGYLMENALAPEILIRKNLWKVLLTFGWRF